MKFVREPIDELEALRMAVVSIQYIESDIEDLKILLREAIKKFKDAGEVKDE